MHKVTILVFLIGLICGMMMGVAINQPVREQAFRGVQG